jgi:hypothetical protein
MPLLTTVELIRIELPTPGEWVDVKAQLSKGEQKKIEAAALGLNIRLHGGMSAQSDVDLSITETVVDALAFRGLELGIVAWSFPEPPTPANIRLLDGASFDQLVTECNKIWKVRTEEETANLSVSSPESSPAKAGTGRASSSG